MIQNDTEESTGEAERYGHEVTGARHHVGEGLLLPGVCVTADA